MLKYEKITFLARKVAPKPEEVSFWIDLSADPYGRVWKYWDGDDWQPLSMGGSGGAVDAYSKAEADLRFATASTLQQVADDVTNKQDTLVSGVNIRTINSQSVLGSGDVRIDVGLTQSQVESIVNNKVSGLVDSAPTTLDTLKEIATALNNDPAFATTITTLIGLKVNTVDYESDKANLATKSELANKADTSELSKYITTEAADAKYALKGEGGDIDLSDYLTTENAASTYATKTELSTKADETDLQGKQDTLVSGTNIKTINNQSILGTGNIEITTGTGGITDAPSDSKLYGRLNGLWAEVPTVDTSSFATQSALTSGLASKVDTATYTDDKATFALKSEIPDTSDFVSKDGGQMHADANLTFRSAGGDKFSMNSSGVKTTGINGTGWKVNLSFSSLTFSDNEDEPGKGARYDARGVEIYDKTENDLLHAGGGTTKLKTINSQSLLGEGNIQIETPEGGITDAPSDGSTYGRKDGAWTLISTPDLSSYATQEYVNTQVSNLVNSAPDALNTLDELAAALGDDANFATTVTNSLANKADKTGAEFTGTIAAPIVAFMRESEGMMGAIQADSNNILFRTYNAGVKSITFQVLNTAALKLTEAGIWENNQLLENKYAQLSDLNDFATTAQLNNKQDTLVSGTNIKTINGESVLGSGDITISSTAAESSMVDITNILYTTSGIKATITSEDYTTLADYIEAADKTMYVAPTFTSTSYISTSIVIDATYSSTTGIVLTLMTHKPATDEAGTLSKISIDASYNVTETAIATGSDNVFDATAIVSSEGTVSEENYDALVAAIDSGKTIIFTYLGDTAHPDVINSNSAILLTAKQIENECIYFQTYTIDSSRTISTVQTLCPSIDYITSDITKLSSSYAAGTATAPAANDTYEQAIAKLHAYVNEHATDITSLQSDVESITGRDTTLRTISLSNVSNEHNYVIAPISSNLTLSFVTSNWSSNTSVHIFVYNSSSSEITVTIPNTGSYVNMSSEILTIPGNTGAEIDAFKDSYNNIWIRHAAGELTITPTTVNDDPPLG